MQLCLNKELYNFVGWYVCRERNNEEQFTLSNSQTDNHVMFTILLFITTSIDKTHLTMALQADDWCWKKLHFTVKNWINKEPDILFQYQEWI